MATVQSMRKDKKPENKFSRPNSRKLFNALPTDPKFNTSTSSSSSSSSSESSITSATATSTSTPTPKPASRQVAKPKSPTTTKPSKLARMSTAPTTYSNEVIVFDVNDTAMLHSLIARNGAWFLDVNDLDMMDKETTFQYLAMRPSPYNNLILTRVPELRHLVYVKFDEDGRPYPVQMRKVSKANYLALTDNNAEGFITEEETTTKEFQSSSFWEALSITLRRSIMFNEPPPPETDA